MPPSPAPDPGPRRAARRALAAGLGLAAAAATIGIALVLARPAERGAPPTPAELLANPALRKELIDELVRFSMGIWDSFPDPDVGRVLQANVELEGKPGAQANRFGLREREYAVPKPEGLVRVVLLGDSFVYGLGVDAEQRVGAFLETALRARSGGAAVEVLHVAASSWNIVAEAEFLRRQLALLAPDLVVHVLFHNDLDDSTGVRGFGTLATFSPQRPDLADAPFTVTHPYQMGFQGTSALTAGLDWESRTRYAGARAAMERLAAAVEARGGRYAVLANWQEDAPVAARLLLDGFAAEQVRFLPRWFHMRQEFRLSAADPHWNPVGHERVAQMLFGWIAERGFLPRLTLARWPRAEQAASELVAMPRDALAAPEAGAAERTIAARVDFSALDGNTASQVHGGVDRHGNVGSYGSLVLRCAGARRLVVRGRCLARPELAGGDVAVLLDEVEVARFPLRAGEPIELDVELDAVLAGAELRAREHVSARFVASDYAYAGEDLRRMLAFQLASVALEPE